MSMGTLLLAHAAITCMLAGLIWTIQLVHYPLFAYADRGSWRAFHAAHGRRISGLVAVLMPLELLLAGLLAWRLQSAEALLGLLLLVVIWLSTALFQVPSHGRLSRRFDADAHRFLVATNWVRTTAWSLRALVALTLLARVMS